MVAVWDPCEEELVQDGGVATTLMAYSLLTEFFADDKAGVKYVFVEPIPLVFGSIGGLKLFFLGRTYLITTQ